MSALRQACDDYLALRRAAGFKLARHGRMLPDLVDYLEAAGLATLTTAATLEWAKLPAGHPQEWTARLSVARGFARYLRTLDSTAEVPPTDLLPGHRRRVAPHLYTDQQIAALMAATEAIHFPQRGATYRTLIGLLAVTGIRIGEAIALDRQDVDLEAGVLRVREGKFNAARELPLHDSTVSALDEFRRLRDRFWPTPVNSTNRPNRRQTTRYTSDTNTTSKGRGRRRYRAPAAHAATTLAPRPDRVCTPYGV